MQHTATSNPALISSQGAAAAAAATRSVALRAAAPAARPTTGHTVSTPADRYRRPQPGAPPPATLRAPTACSAYSRTSWRTAVQDEAGDTPTPSPDPQPGAAVLSAARGSADDPHPRNGPGAHHGSGAHNGDGGGGGGGGADGGCTLTAAELRVKLVVAVGSGRLDLTDCRLQRLPDEVLELSELEELQLSGNCLSQLPDGISRLTSLRRLGLAGNLLTSLPPGFGALTGLEGLWLHGNLLASLPQQLGSLGALRALSLAGNCLESIPAGSLSGLTSLTELTLAGNRLTALPPRELAPLGRLRKLALNGNRLTGGVPGELGLGPHMTALTELMMQGNHLETVDPDIFECPALQELSLADNRLTDLPPRLASAPSLARLHLFGNRLSRISPRQLAGLTALSACWLEGNPLRGEVVSELVALARSGAVPKLKALGLDQSQLPPAAAAPGHTGASSGLTGSSLVGSPNPTTSSTSSLPQSVRVGCVLGSGPGYFKLQYGPQRSAGDGAPRSGGGGGVGGATAASGGGGGAAGCLGVRSSNELLVVAFGSAPGTPNWGGLLSKVYRAAGADEGGRYFDVLYVADPARDWYGGGDDHVYDYYRERLSCYTRSYRRVLLLGDSMGATAALLFADLATGALAFCPQVDLTAASIRPGRPAAWLDRLRGRLVAAVRASTGELGVLVGTWQHDLDQANLLPARTGAGGPQDGRRRTGGSLGGERASGGGRGSRGSALRSWRDADPAESPGGDVVGAAMLGGLAPQEPAGLAPLRKPWSWEQGAESGVGVQAGRGVGLGATGSLSERQTARDDALAGSGSGGVNVKVFSVDSHRLAAALDARGQLVPLVLDAVLHQLGLRSGNVRIANLL